MPLTRVADLLEGNADGPVGTAPALRRSLLRAEVVYDGLGTPREGAAMALQSTAAGSTLAGVGPLEEQRAAHSGAPVLDAGFAVTPRVVNAHTHLDLSTMPYTPGSYVGFISAVIAHGRAGHRGVEAARQGVAALMAGGTTVVGDVVARAEVMEYLLEQTDVTGVAYWEVLGPDPATADEVFEATVATINGYRARQRPGGMRVGVSPHTPHTVSARLMQRLCRWAASEHLPLAIHVAESPSEARLHRSGDGELAAALRGVGAPFAATGASPVAYLDRLGVLAAAPTLVHMVEVDEDDVRSVQRHGCVVVHCPRSNAALGCGRFPWELYARHGVDVAFGTDSLGSSPSLDVTQEVCAALALHGVRANARGLVRAAVKGGHKALGLRPPIVTRGTDAADLMAWGRCASVSSARHPAGPTGS